MTYNSQSGLLHLSGRRHLADLYCDDLVLSELRFPHCVLSGQVFSSSLKRKNYSFLIFLFPFSYFPSALASCLFPSVHFQRDVDTKMLYAFLDFPF